MGAQQLPLLKVRDTTVFVTRGAQVLGLWRRALLPIAVGLIGGVFVLVPVVETSSGSKTLQLMTGMSGVTYWLAHYFFDLILYMPAWLVVGVIFSYFNRIRVDTARK